MSRNKKNKKTRKLLFVVFLFVFVLTLAKIVVANVLATTGNELGKLENEVLALKEEKQLAEEELTRLSTLARISEEAESLGFGKATSIVFLQEQVSVALR